MSRTQELLVENLKEECTLDGFRLKELQVYNWGTFHGKVWKLTANRQTTLLCGSNGSGKSTLVDALLTLLVPSIKRNYNVASSVERKRERDEKSYMLGAYGKKRDEIQQISKVEYLRDKDDYSVVLGHFEDLTSSKEVTIAQVFYFQNDNFRKIHIVSQKRLTVQENFSQFQNISALKKQIKAIAQTEVFDQFCDYSARFRSLMGIRSEKALDLFNQTVAIKEIGNLNDFIRKHMLEKVDVLQRIDLLRGNFNNLNKAHQAIIKAKHQLEYLTPLVKDMDRFETMIESIAFLNDLIQSIPIYFSRKKIELIEQSLKSTSLQLEQLINQIKALKEQCDSLRLEEVDILTAINQDQQGRRISELQKQVQHLSKDIDRKKAQSKRYNECAHRLGLKEDPSEKQFVSTREHIVKLQEQNDSGLNELLGQRDDLKIRQSQLVQAIQQLENELNSLLERKNQIPLKNVQLRDRLAKDLDISVRDIPFVGELLKVCDGVKDWEGAIERVLHHFGLRILIPEELYLRINNYVNKTDLKGLLVYHRVTKETPFSRIEEGNDYLYQKLEIHPKTVHYDWLKQYLLSHYDYVCCSRIKNFQKQIKGITKEGLLKRAGHLHEKDDRRSIHNRALYILGWDNKEKIVVLKKELVDQKQTLVGIEKRINSVERKQKDLQKSQDSLRDLFGFADYEDINFRKDQDHVKHIEKNIKEMEQSSNKLKQLKLDLKQVQGRVRDSEEACHQKEKQETNLERDIEEFNQQRKKCEEVIGQQSPDSKSFKKQDQAVDGFLKDVCLTIKNCDDYRENTLASFYEQRDKKNKIREGLDKKIVLQMEKFKAAFPEVSMEMDSSMASEDDFRRIQKNISNDDLPRYEKRFKELLDQKVIMDISSFYNFLTKHISIIKEKIQSLNESLRVIDYSPSTFIQLNTESNRDPQIKEFQLMLKDCFEDVGMDGSGKANERSFIKIKKIIERFDTEEYWTKKVIDVRNWLNFSASERYREDQSEKNYFSDSSGKSGGQKAKLAYTILASAIAYQYGLHSVDMFSGSFRFVVIDEAFSKSDDANAQYAMELFKKLDLQLLVVTPLDKTHVVEPYIRACHYVVNIEKENDSKVYNLTIEEYREKQKNFECL